MLAKANGAPRIVMSFEDFEPFVSAQFGDTHTISVPRKRIIEAGGYPTGYKECEDVFLLTKLCAASRRIGVICTLFVVFVFFVFCVLWLVAFAVLLLFVCSLVLL